MSRSLLLAVVALAFVGCAELAVLLPPEPGGGASSPVPSSSGRTLVVDGLVHRATRAQPVKRIAFKPPSGSYRSLHLEVTVTHGGWAKANPGGTHNLFWLARERNRDLFGYANIRNHRDLFIRYGIGIPQRDKARVSKRAPWAPGASYRLVYRYDAAAGQVELVVREGSREVTRLTGRADQRSVHLAAGQRFFVDLGFTGTDNPNEPASLGWAWRDLRLEVR